MTKTDYPETISAAREFKKLFDETIMADVNRGINLTPFESEIHNTGRKISQMLERLLSMYND